MTTINTITTKLRKVSATGIASLIFFMAAPGLQMEAAMAEQLESKMLTAQILPLAKSGEIVLIDIRSAQEWAQTGVAEFARTNSMHEPGFLDRLDQILNGDKTRTIALICATGGRSSHMHSELKQRGYNNVVDVTDGMIGSGAGPGWLGNGFATRKVQ